MSAPATDDELRETFRRILALDEECPLTLDARLGILSDPHGTPILMGGFLMGTVSRLTGEVIDRDRAIRIAREVFASMQPDGALHG